MAVATCTDFYCDATNGSNLYSGSTASGTPVYTHASGNWVNSTGVFTPTDGRTTSTYVTVGDFASVYPDAAAVTPFVGRVTAVGAGANGTITVSNTYKAGTKPADSTGGTTLVVGGCWKGPNGSSGFPFGFVTNTLVNTSSNATRVNFKNNATYNVTAAMTHTGSGHVKFQGYSSSVADGGKATIDGGTSGSSYVVLTITHGKGGELADFIFSHNGATGAQVGLQISYGICRRVVVCNMTGSGFFNPTGATYFLECEAYSNGGSGFYLGVNPSQAHRCIAHHNTEYGFKTYSSGGLYFEMFDCIAFQNTSHGAHFISRDCLIPCYMTNCDFYYNGGSGILIGNADNSTPGSVLVQNCNFFRNGGYGIAAVYGANVVNVLIRNCAFGAGTRQNTSGQIDSTWNVVEQTGNITLAANQTPWVDPDNGDFRINHATVKGAGFGTYTQTAAGYAGTVGYPDIGAAQHQDSASGGGGVRVIGG